MVSFGFGQWFGFDVNDILVYFQRFSRRWQAVPNRREFGELKTCVKETLNGSIRDLRWVIKLIDLRRVKGVFNLLIVELLHFRVTLSLLVSKKLIIQEIKIIIDNSNKLNS
jgi:hypothetical protein